jgi:hypothetical protein
MTHTVTPQEAAKQYVGDEQMEQAQKQLALEEFKEDGDLPKFLERTGEYTQPVDEDELSDDFDLKTSDKDGNVQVKNVN